VLTVLLLSLLHAPTETPTAAIDLNSATPAMLMMLPGVGPKRAEAIVKARTEKPFRKVQDVLRVPGIGPKTLARLLKWIRVDPPPPPQPSPKTPPSPGGARGPRTSRLTIDGARL
jgi:competence protein ComEA